MVQQNISLKNSETVTVITPVLNAQKYIEEFLQALEGQCYPKELVEIIIVDNGSTDNTVGLVQAYPIKLIIEDDIESPYAARNRGLEAATGEYIALIDANKIPNVDWLTEGITAIKSSRADLLGGAILFSLPDSPSVSNMYDAITFNNNYRLVTIEKGSAAGNLFFRRSLIDDIGMFPEKFRSGMDIWWTQKAVRGGYKLEYSEKAIVFCKPRNFKEVMAKSYRVGKIHPFNQRQNGVSLLSIFGNTIKTFAPPGIGRWNEYRSYTESSLYLINLWFIAWMSKICMGTGRVAGLFKMRNQKPQ